MQQKSVTGNSKLCLAGSILQIEPKQLA